jgi:hypothetical protein
MKKYAAQIRIARLHLANDNLRAYRYGMSGLLRSAPSGRSAQYLCSQIRADGFDIRQRGGQPVMAEDILPAASGRLLRWPQPCAADIVPAAAGGAA